MNGDGKCGDGADGKGWVGGWVGERGFQTPSVAHAQFHTLLPVRGIVALLRMNVIIRALLCLILAQNPLAGLATPSHTHR